MKKLSVGLIDYGMGNHASVTHKLRQLGMRVRISETPELLDQVDVLLLPGVGAFPAAMYELHRRGLIDYISDAVRAQRPLVGICLGMQLLTSASCEYGYTAGLDLIPGEIVPFKGGGWHIGWNALELVRFDRLLQASDGHIFYFNHSFHYQGPEEYQLAITRHRSPFVSVIRRGKVIGLQFHPEKSQIVGSQLLFNIINGLVDA
jgi:glutamine amidotransferase